MNDKLLISPIFKSFSKFRKIGYKKIINNSLFKFGIKIKNINNLSFDGAKISNIEIKNISKNLDYMIVSATEYKIPPLNPDESTIIWFEKTIVSFSGGAWIDLDIKNKNKIKTYQWDKGNNIPGKMAFIDHWKDTFIIKDENILQQIITNILLIILTTALVLKEIIPFIIKITTSFIK